MPDVGCVSDGDVGLTCLDVDIGCAVYIHIADVNCLTYVTVTFLVLI